MSIPKFQIDNRDEIIRIRNEMKREMDRQEEMEAMAAQELLLKGDVKKQEEDKLEQKRKEEYRKEQEMKEQKQYERAQEQREEQRQFKESVELTMRLNGNGKGKWRFG